MATLWPLVRKHMQEAQEAQARVYNRGAQLREFQQGDKVLVLVPTSECKFLARWKGPYEIIEKVGEVNYRERRPVVPGRPSLPVGAGGGGGCVAAIRRQPAKW
ncbi:hypothetical protein SKAU_G00019410 [Synaphobranchus kaupii]|uniref:Uncharacterized protein n=1 Tax=Synaphobranchus kaupii TaxID=118154 RepID=A0A9Q1JCZ4_SYNKA|nr:hypothetical protein SKAU_G00019410 [Synaphobranchus kaupii]